MFSTCLRFLSGQQWSPNTTSPVFPKLFNNKLDVFASFRQSVWPTDLHSFCLVFLFLGKNLVDRTFFRLVDTPVSLDEPCCSSESADGFQPEKGERRGSLFQTKKISATVLGRRSRDSPCETWSVQKVWNLAGDVTRASWTA